MRAPGFYWVMWDGEWEVALWKYKYWHVAGDDAAFIDTDMDEIDERRIERPE